MPNDLTALNLEFIVSNFDTNITEYEIINMEKYQGWSSKYLFLLVTKDDDYILKGKTKDQISGYDNEVKVCQALIDHKVNTRDPVLTKDKKYLFKSGDLYWCLMTFVPGTASHVEEYSLSTVKTLAQHIDEYITDTKLLNLDLNPIVQANDIKILDQVITVKDQLKTLGIIKGSELAGLINISECIKSGYEKNLGNTSRKSLIHNDINPRNILIDHVSKNVVSIIDWDHVMFADPLKDLADAVSIFYEYLPFEKAKKFKDHFYKCFQSEWFTTLPKDTLDFSHVYYYTIAKWKSILFYLDLLNKYDNKYGERDRFINEIKITYKNWENFVKTYI